MTKQNKYKSPKPKREHKVIPLRKKRKKPLHYGGGDGCA